ncbi:TIGR03960 family B12-binding radical SAM protein [Ruminiclostridium herbifermentans]|uniref:TIGR03960 family B12-binding radical SAM protein n=1 Tax=Ruminiclostridium herbifermentans TaxID=2488810 RepID=A0A4U7JLV5_9FIRM|nr:TIGR03960 family B12-binding radical SAM protein [Ruminiclostridium herbifermentans]QNU68249.1 TIGR03960 family B12-binding radical SAM protein [Ruminiclostridium herbifermentans]
MSIRLSDGLLKSVEKPSRYTGNEWNSVIKDPKTVDIRFAFCFPDTYEIGMSHLGMKILYHLLNERQDCYCERVFAPWTDMEAKMRENNIPLYALETKDEIKNFDFIGFTLQYEMSFTNIVNMLDLAGVPLTTADRKDNDPFVCAGGPCAYNPEPLADIIDFFMLGEGEEIINEVMDEYVKWKGTGKSRIAFLEEIAKLEGIYVPSFYEFDYNEDGTIKSFTPIKPQYPVKIKKRIIKDMDKVYYPEKMIVPYTDIVHDRIMLEVFRGCIRGCRFCQAGFIYRPVREKSHERLMELAKKLEESTGYEEISLTSLSTSDYSQLEEFTTELLDEMKERKVGLSLPSLRLDSFSLDLMEKAQKVRKSGLTFAPEAGTQRLRDVINKGITEEDLLNAVSLAFNGGWHGVKLYFMLGLPTETNEDVEGIADLAHKVVHAYKRVPMEKKGKGLNVTVSTATFVPKAFTPFQWEAQDSIENVSQKQMLLKERIRSKQITYNYHENKLSFLEAVFARGDRRICKALIKAWELGCKFDGWGEYFKYDIWMKAFEECGVDPYFYATRKREYDEILPWDHIDIGVSKKFLINESKKAYEEKITPNCRVNCGGCGAAVFESGICGGNGIG